MYAHVCTKNKRRTQGMLKTAVTGTWPDERRCPELFNVTKPLELTSTAHISGHRRIRRGKTKLVRVNKLAEEGVYWNWTPRVTATKLMSARKTYCSRELDL
jgi:hypothetical protein